VDDSFDVHFAELAKHGKPIMLAQDAAILFPPAPRVREVTIEGETTRVIELNEGSQKVMIWGELASDILDGYAQQPAPTDMKTKPKRKRKG
jgi:hypothetical protein